jgi:hypothetical protein
MPDLISTLAHTKSVQSCTHPINFWERMFCNVSPHVCSLSHYHYMFTTCSSIEEMVHGKLGSLYQIALDDTINIYRNECQWRLVNFDINDSFKIFQFQLLLSNNHLLYPNIPSICCHQPNPISDERNKRIRKIQEKL